MKGGMKIAKSLIEFGLLITGVSEAIENEAKEEKERWIFGHVLWCPR